jgi:hypothetical protein
MRVRNAGADRDAERLYDLIWKRTLASQMADAELEKTVVDIAISTRPGRALKAQGEVILFDGFLKVYMEGKDDEDSDEEQEGLLPDMKQGEDLATARDDRHPALRSARTALHGSQPGEEARRTRHRPTEHLRAHHQHRAEARLCGEGEPRWHAARLPHPHLGRERHHREDRDRERRRGEAEALPHGHRHGGERFPGGALPHASWTSTSRPRWKRSST